MKDRNKSSILNAITAICLTISNGMFGVLVTWLVIKKYGSDFNGLNSLASQITNVLLVLEGGFTIASVVTLFKPLEQSDLRKINSIIFTTKKKFKKIGTLFFVIGIPAALFFTVFMKSDLQKPLIFSIIMMAVLPSGVNLFLTSAFRVLLQADQKEYIINIATAITVSMGHIVNILVIYMGRSMWLIRFNTMIFSLINSIIIILYVKSRYDSLNYKSEQYEVAITGTKDVMVQKITGVVYNCMPVLVLSVMPTGGTAFVSVYAVYNNIYSLMKNILHGFTDAPRHSIGQVVAVKDREYVWTVFRQYEMIVMNMEFIFVVTCSVMIFPFIDIYTKGIADANYYDAKIAVLMSSIVAFEIVHIPSGHLINMAGEFKTARNIQIIACVALGILMPFGCLIYGIYGLLTANLIVSILLCILEVLFVHKVYFANKLIGFEKMVLPIAACGILAFLIEHKIIGNTGGLFKFIFSAVFIIMLNSMIVFGLDLFIDRQDTIVILKRLKSFFGKNSENRGSFR